MIQHTHQLSTVKILILIFSGNKAALEAAAKINLMLICLFAICHFLPIGFITILLRYPCKCIYIYIYLYLFILISFFLFPPSKRRESKPKRINGSFRFRLFGRISPTSVSVRFWSGWWCGGGWHRWLSEKTEALNHLGCEKVQEMHSIAKKLWFVSLICKRLSLQKL